MNSLIGLTLTLVYIENSWPFSPQIIFYSWLPLTVHFLAFLHMSLPSQTPLTFLLRNLNVRVLLFCSRVPLVIVPHSLEGISASLLALNFNRLPKTPKPISPALTFSQISRPAQQTSHTVLLAGLMSISNLTWPKQSFPFFYVRNCFSANFPVSVLTTTRNFIGSNKKSWHYLWFLSFISSLPFLLANPPENLDRSTTKAEPKSATSFHYPPGP